MKHHLLFTLSTVLSLAPSTSIAQESVAERRPDNIAGAACVSGDPMPVGVLPEGSAALPAPAPSGTAPIPIPNACDVQASARTVRIRGTNAPARPLFVIDGAIVGRGEAGMDPVASIGAGNIESVTVLKNGSAAAQYGPEGRNGVVIVRTKTPQAPGLGREAADAP